MNRGYLHNWMWSEACALLHGADRLQQRFVRPSFSHDGFANWEPPIDVYETNREILVLAVMPGVAPDKIDIHMDANVMVVSGHRSFPAGVRDAVVHTLEIPHGLFERRIELSMGNLQISKQEFSNGCLMVYLEKQASQPGKEHA